MAARTNARLDATASALGADIPTRFRSSKASGSFCCSKLGSYELLIHMESDPQIWTYSEFDFASILPRRLASPLDELATFTAAHAAGRYVLCVVPDAVRRAPGFAKAWKQADRVLAERQTWLLPRSFEELRTLPRWANALRVARSAQESFICPADRSRLVEHLAKAGSASLGHCMRLCFGSDDGFDAVLRLVSTGALWLDLDLDLSAETTIRLHPDQIRAAIASQPR
ncbi:hypothetical protein LJR009_002876 [Bosea sp. LjRoot9]|uniref:hypothetical protein n=1 Tax=Bosea sp. LjRoot9 TaxID=3342341 RepID=UPI003ED0D00B